MSTATTTPTTVELPEVETGGHLLKFKQPLLVEVDEDADSCGLWIHSLELGAAGRDSAEAWDMLADLLVSAYEEYRSLPDDSLDLGARQQRDALMQAVSGHYIQ